MPSKKCETEVQWKTTSTNQYCYVCLQNEMLYQPLHNNTKIDKICTKRGKSVST